MKNGSLSTKLLLAAICAMVLIYFGINTVAYFMDPYTTTAAYSYTSENAVTVSGYVVRDEEPLDEGEGENKIYLTPLNEVVELTADKEL